MDYTDNNTNKKEKKSNCNMITQLKKSITYVQNKIKI